MAFKLRVLSKIKVDVKIGKVPVKIGKVQPNILRINS